MLGMASRITRVSRHEGRIAVPYGRMCASQAQQGARSALHVRLTDPDSRPVPPKASAANSGTYGAKTDAHVKAEIAAIIKQITASCTFLPMLEQQCE